MKKNTKSSNKSRIAKVRPVAHAKRIINITPKFIHGMAVGAVVGVLLVGSLRYVSMVSAGSSSFTASACIVKPVVLPNGIGLFKSFTMNANNTVTDTFIVAGQNGCKVNVSVDSWQAPYGSKNFLPFDQQKFVDENAGVYSPGQYSLTVKINATCNYQVDLVPGPNHAKASGWPDYTYGQVADFLQAGNKVCEPPVTPVTPTNPTNPTTPTTPTTTVETASQPTTLANTGPGAVIIIGILAVIGGYLFHRAHHHVKHRRHHTTHHSA